MYFKNMCIARVSDKEDYVEMGLVCDFEGNIHILKNPRYPDPLPVEKFKLQRRSQTIITCNYNVFTTFVHPRDYPDMICLYEMLIIDHLDWIQKNMVNRKSRQKDAMSIGKYSLELLYVNPERCESKVMSNHLYREKYVTPQRVRRKE